MNKKLIAAVVPLTIAASLATAAPALAVETIDQGFRFGTSSGRSCTIAYVEDRIAHTAGHCGRDGDEVTFYGKPQVIGTFRTTWSIDDSDANKEHGIGDYAYIEFNDDFRGGENIYSGDNIINPEDVAIGDTISSYGASSNKSYSGKVTGSRKNDFLAEKTAGGIPGDSGGPAWIEGKGFVGIYLGSLTTWGENRVPISKRYTFIGGNVGGNLFNVTTTSDDYRENIGKSVITGEKVTEKTTTPRPSENSRPDKEDVPVPQTRPTPTNTPPSPTNTTPKPQTRHPSAPAPVAPPRANAPRPVEQNSNPPRVAPAPAPVPAPAPRVTFPTQRPTQTPPRVTPTPAPQPPAPQAKIVVPDNTENQVVVTTTEVTARKVG